MFIVFIILIVVTALVLINTYNRLRRSSEAVKRGRSDMLGELRKRAALVNQLIEVCKGYGDHEKLTHITVGGQMTSLSEAASVSKATNTVLERVQLMAANFPELKANETYAMLMRQLHEIENALQQKREAYNREVESYNSFRSSFPQVLFSQQLGFPEAPYFTTDDLDGTNEFRTDDGSMLRERMAQIGQVASNATKVIAHKAADAFQHAHVAGAQLVEDARTRAVAPSNAKLTPLPQDRNVDSPTHAADESTASSLEGGPASQPALPDRESVPQAGGETPERVH